MWFTNGEKYVLDGHHRLEAAKRLGLREVPAQLGYKSITDLFN